MVKRDIVNFVDRIVKAPPPRKTPLPRGAQWVHHEKPGSRAAQRRLRQMGAEAGAITADQANAEARQAAGGSR